jgi:DNA-binding MarR family transcriptional regulator
MPSRARPHKTAATADASFEIADRLHSLAIHLLRRVRREDAATGLPAPRLSALSVIVFRGPVTVGELAHAEQVRPPTMTRIVTALEEDGLVERSGDDSDRRVVRVKATAEGLRVLEEGRRRRIAALARDLAALPAADRVSLARAADVLERIIGPRHWPAKRDRSR